MSPMAAPAVGLVRVTVTSSTRRVDLALPGAVAVADLLPELARSVGMLDVATASRGYQAVTHGGRVLRPDRGLAAQGVAHGEVLSVVVVGDRAPVLLHDDVAEAVTELVEGAAQPCCAAALGQSVMCVATVLLLVAAAGLATQHGSVTASASSAGTAGMLACGAVVASRAHARAVAGVVLAHLAAVHAAVAGLDLRGGDGLDGRAVALAGAGLLAVGIVTAGGMTVGRVLMLPAVAVGALSLTTGVLMETVTPDATALLPVVLVLIVLVSGTFPGLALSAAGAGRHRSDATDIAEGASDIDMSRLSTELRLAREILLSASVTSGLLLVLLAPVATATGPTGIALPVLSGAIVILRTRRYRQALDVVVGLASGLAVLVSSLVTLWWLDDARRLPAALLVVGAVLLLLGHGVRRPVGGYRRARLGDRVETAALVALVPSLVVTLVTRTP
jgi:hypothetical protein